MTADMPDAVKVAREAAATYWTALGNEKTAASIRAGQRDWLDTVQSAILGARAMQDAMSGRVKVKAPVWEEGHAAEIAEAQQSVAEAERDALKAEVEKLRIALGGAG